jgi:hypothetical protein
MEFLLQWHLIAKPYRYEKTNTTLCTFPMRTVLG